MNFLFTRCDVRVKNRYMNESRLYPNKSDPENKMIKKRLKRNESYYLYQIMCTFFFDGPSIVTLWYLHVGEDKTYCK